MEWNVRVGKQISSDKSCGILLFVSSRPIAIPAGLYRGAVKCTRFVQVGQSDPPFIDIMVFLGLFFCYRMIDALEIVPKTCTVNI